MTRTFKAMKLWEETIPKIVTVKGWVEMADAKNSSLAEVVDAVFNEIIFSIDEKRLKWDKEKKRILLA